MKPQPAPHTSRFRQPTRRIATWILMCLVVIGMVCLHLSDPSPRIHGPLKTSGSDSVPLEKRIAIAQEKLKALSTRYADAQRHDVAATEKEIGRLIAEAESQTPTRAVEAARPFMGFGNVAKCVSYGARDQVTGSDTFGAYAAEGLSPAANLLGNTQKDILAALEALRQLSLVRVNEFSRDSLQIATAAEIEPAALGLDPEALCSLGAGADRLVTASTEAVASTALEVIFVRATWSSLNRLLQPMIAKAAKTAGAAGGSALIDGPLPFGEAIGALIAVGGGLWTAWDIGQAIEAHEQLPYELEQALRQQIRSLDQSAHSHLDSLRLSLAELYQIDS